MYRSVELPSKHRSSSSVPVAAFLGWLPVALVNAVFVERVAMRLDLGKRLVHHLYDAGQVLGLGVASWTVWCLSLRLPPKLRLPLGCLALFATHYALLGPDLESFMRRNPDSTARW